jgi:hypothetical protein
VRFRNDYRLKKTPSGNAEAFRLSIVSEKCFDKTIIFNAGFDCGFGFVYESRLPLTRTKTSVDCWCLYTRSWLFLSLLDLSALGSLILAFTSVIK